MVTSSTGWCRVVAGARLVASAASKNAVDNATTAMTRASRHGGDIVSSVRKAAPPLPMPSIHASDSATMMMMVDHMLSSPGKQASQDGAGLVNTVEQIQNLNSPQPSNEYAMNEQGIERLSKESSLASTTTISTQRNPTLQDGPDHYVENRMMERKIEGQANADKFVENLREGQAVPSTRFGRAWGFASLGMGLAVGTASEVAARMTGIGKTSSSSLVINDANADRLASTLCRMRGAALKMGQMLSIQDESLLPPELSRALNQVRQGADAMPEYQLERQMEAQLGPDWMEKFVHFEKAPFAAASVGQVHRATITKDGQSDQLQNVVVKVQYPGVARSIKSDLGNLAMLVKWTGFAPPGLFIENVIRVGEQELQSECNYQQEMTNQKKMKALVEADPILRKELFVVPDVIEDLTASEVITGDFARGGTIDKVSHLDQEERNRIGRTILYLTMKELFAWRFMQTDPNWGNFLYDVGTRTTSLIDFGAAREYDKSFVDGYLRIVWASANQDEETLMDMSRRMKFLTGEENEAMVRAHIMSGYTVGEPFRADEPYDFRGSKISSRMSDHTAVFLKHRLTAPPEEVYTLHRKLAGAYMLCIKLGAIVRCRDLLHEVVSNHDFQDGLEPPIV